MMTLRDKRLEKLEAEWRQGVPIREIARDIRAAPSTVFRWIKRFREIDEVIREEEERERRIAAEQARQERLRRQRELREEAKKRKREIELAALMAAMRQEKEYAVDTMIKRGDYFVIMAHKFIRKYPAYFFWTVVYSHCKEEEAFSEFLKLLKENVEFKSDFKEFCINEMNVERLKRNSDYWRPLPITTFSDERNIYQIATEYLNIEESNIKDRFIFQLVHPELFRFLGRDTS
jgi:transposase-like protein